MSRTPGPPVLKIQLSWGCIPPNLPSGLRLLFGVYYMKNPHYAPGRCSIEHPRTYLDYCSTTTEMPSSLQTPRSDAETDLLENFTQPYEGREGYTVLDGDTESFCVSIDFGAESEEPFVFPVTIAAVNDIDRKVATKKKAHVRRKNSRALRSSSESKRSRVSLPTKFGSRNHSKGSGVREVISDTQLLTCDQAFFLFFSRREKRTPDTIP